MAGTAVIGALRVTLGLDSAEFMKAGKTIDRQINHMERKFRDMGRSLQRTGTQLSAGITAPLTALGLAFGRTAQVMAQNARDMQTSAQVAGEGFEEFQRQAHAASQVGIEYEKLGDIFKDMRDRVGDFISTGAGPMADFFENIAPKVGITAEAFRGLSGRDALQLYFDSLRKANVSQEEMVFYLEAMASDATALIPLLAQGEEGWRRYGATAAVIAEDEIDNFNELRLAQESLEKSWQSLTIAVVSSSLLDGVVSVAQAISSLFQRISQTNPALLQGAAVVGTVAAAMGPLVYTVGTLTTALAPLGAAFTVATHAMQAATGATGVATLTLAGLRAGITALMATLGPWVLAIGAASAALYLLTRRNGEALEQAEAFRIGLRSMGEEQNRTRELTLRLASATGQLREEILATMRARRADRIDELRIRQERLAELRRDTRERLREAQGQRDRAMRSTVGAGSGYDPALGAISDIDRVIGEGRAREAMIAGEMHSLAIEIGRMNQSINAPAPNYSGGGGGAAGAVASAASAAAREVDELQSLMDELWPELARLREFREKLAKLPFLPEDMREEGERRLREQLAGYEPGNLPDNPVDIADWVPPDVEEALRGVSDEAGRWAEDMEDVNERVIDSFRYMVTDVQYSLNSFANSIKGGNVLDIFAGLLGALDSIGALMTGGKGFNIGGILFGGARAMGGPVNAGSAYLVGENGPEVMVPGHSGHIVPNHKLGGQAVVNNFYTLPSEQFWAQVDGRADVRIGAAAPAIARAGADTAVARQRHAQQWALG